MFKKLKDKIAEEVKQSPLKSVQQLAQAVVSPSSSSVFEPSSSNDKFCIEEGDNEDDERQEQAKPGGFTSVTLTGQTASPARDHSQKYGLRRPSGSLMVEADNLFPKFEPQPTTYNVQSDWESTSEVEDRYSQLEHINKESLYEAYRKTWNRLNKLKVKYHEVVTHYRQLEREKEKARTVLTETQDKALLRISELREQCLLEQQAKAHLEEALRNELEERDHIINSLRTKVQYLKGVGDSTGKECADEASLLKEDGNLIDFTEAASVSTVPLPTNASSIEDKINWIEGKLKLIKITCHEEMQSLEQLKHRSNGVRELNVEFEESCPENEHDIQASELKRQNEVEVTKALAHIISKLSTEVLNLQQSSTKCLTLFAGNKEPDLKTEIGQISLNSNSQGVQDDEMRRYSTLIKQLEEDNKALSEKLKNEISSLEDLKNELLSLQTSSDLLKSKIKLSNQNFGKNDAINCLIENEESELIHEWNLCFQNFLQTRCEVTVLKDTKEDLEKELLRIKEENKRIESVNKEIADKNSKYDVDIKTLKRNLQDLQNQFETLPKEKNDLKVRYEDLEKQFDKTNKELKQYQDAFGEKNAFFQRVLDEKDAVEMERNNLNGELERIRSEYCILLDEKQKMDSEIISLRKENSDVMNEKEALNNKVNETENKLQLVKQEYKVMLEGLENQINSLSNLNEDLASEQAKTMLKLSNNEKDLETNKQNNLLLLKEKDKVSLELEQLKSEYEAIVKEKLSINEKLNSVSEELEKTKLSSSNSLKTLSQQHSDDIELLKGEKDKLIKENCILETNMEILKQDIIKLETTCNESTNIEENMARELSSVNKERDNLLSEIKLQKNKVGELETLLIATNEELSILKREHAELTICKSDIQNELRRLQECLDRNIENQSSSSEDNLKLSEEIFSLKKEKEDLLRKKSTLESEFKTLNIEFLASKEELAKLTEEHEKLSGKLHVLERDHKDLIISKQNELDYTEEIKSHLEENKTKLLSANEINCKLSEEILLLNSSNTKTQEELKLLKDQHNNCIAEQEISKGLVLSLTEEKNRLSKEISSLKKDCEICNDNIKQSKAQLQKEENINLELKNQLCSLSESFKIKCEETNEKHKENISLKSDMDKLMDKINLQNSSIEKLSKEKNVILNYLLTNFNNVKVIKELQKNLYCFVKQFQGEISREIVSINTKFDHDFFKHQNNEQNPEKSDINLHELDSKRKENINSYNSKLKNLQDLSNIHEKVLKVNVKDLENTFSEEKEHDVSSNVVAFRQMGHMEKLSDLESVELNNVEAYLKKAILLMKSFTNLLNHNSMNSDYAVDLFAPNNDKYVRLNDSEGKNLQKEILAMETFITDFETKYCNTLSTKFSSQESAESAEDHCGHTEIKLRQEIGLRDDEIKTLRSVIDEYEQKKDVDDNEFLYKQKVLMLEQENSSLAEQLKKLQEKHELNVKNIILEYENKLEESEQESNLYDFEKLGKEKKHVENEMKEHIQSLQQDLEERGDAFEKLYEEHQQSVKNWNEEVQQLRSRHDKELREQDKKWRQCLDRRLAEEEARHQQELASLNMQWNAERRELETARRLAVNAVESGSGSNELLRRQVQVLTLELTELRNNRCEACNHKRKSESGDQRSRSIQDCTEMEYLRNILYEYMMGKEPLVLAKVLCALVKFDENQTKEIVSKEEHRITLFGQLGLL